MKIRVTFPLEISVETVELFWRSKTGHWGAWFGHTARHQAVQMIRAYVENHGCADLNDAIEEAQKEAASALHTR